MNFRLAASFAAAAALALAACTVLPTPSAPPPAPSKIKLAVMKGCGFVPTPETIASILTASPYVLAADAVAKAICDAVTTLPLADGPGDRLPRVNGVVVRGYFVK